MRKLLLALIIFGGAYYLYDHSFFFPKKAAPEIVKETKSEPVSLAFLKIKGKVVIEKNNTTEEVNEGLIIDSHCIIKTSDKSFAILAYGPGLSSKIKIGENASVELLNIEHLPNQKEGINFHLLTGDLLLKILNSNNEIALNIKTKLAKIKTRSSTLFVRTSDASTLLLVKDGSVELEANEESGVLYTYENTGYLIKSPGKAIKVNTQDSNINWDIDSPSSELMLSNDTFETILSSAIEHFKNDVETVNTTLKKKKREISELEDFNELELSNLEKDIACLNSKVTNCDLKSEVFAKDILHKRGNLKNIFTSSISPRLQEEIENYKQQLTERLNAARVEATATEKSAAELDSKYQLIHSKYNQVSSPDAKLKEEDKKNGYKEIVNLLNNENLNNEFEKYMHKLEVNP